MEPDEQPTELLSECMYVSHKDGVHRTLDSGKTWKVFRPAWHYRLFQRLSRWHNEHMWKPVPHV